MGYICQHRRCWKRGYEFRLLSDSATCPDDHTRKTTASETLPICRHDNSMLHVSPLMRDAGRWNRQGFPAGRNHHPWQTFPEDGTSRRLLCVELVPCDVGALRNYRYVIPRCQAKKPATGRLSDNILISRHGRQPPRGYRAMVHASPARTNSMSIYTGQ